MHPAFQEFRTLLTRRRRFLLTTHLNPDGDGIGSELALARALHARGIHATILNADPTPSNYRFLDPEGSILHFDPPVHETLVREAEAIIVVDTNTPDRLGKLKTPVLESNAEIVCIDHHLEPHAFVTLAIIDDGAAATGEIVANLLSFLG
ncbi:MAG: DHH family phosphoesterase, partial [Bacteroidota bacterium]